MQFKMRNLGLEIRNKIAKQKAIGHTAACIVPHKLMEEWAELADELVKNNGTLNDNIVSDNECKVCHKTTVSEKANCGICSDE